MKGMKAWQLDLPSYERRAAAEDTHNAKARKEHATASTSECFTPTRSRAETNKGIAPIYTCYSDFSIYSCCSLLYLSSPAGNRILDGRQQARSPLRWYLGRPHCNSYAMQLDLALAIPLHTLPTNRLIKDSLHPVPFFVLQHGNLAQRAKTIPNGILTQPYLPRLDILSQRQCEQRVCGRGDGQRVRG